MYVADFSDGVLHEERENIQINTLKWNFNQSFSIIVCKDALGKIQEQRD